MNEKNIALLKARLVQLGFEPSVETMLRCHLCFQPAGFDLSCSRVVGADQFGFVVHVEGVDHADYALLHYTATLRKGVIVPAELGSLSNAMEAIDWNGIVSGKQVAGNIGNESVQAAVEILEKLKAIGSLADILKFKYWVGTALEGMVPQLSALKAEWEIAERFYILDEAALITFDDAVRFLSSRWVEKQMLARKRLLVKKTEGTRSSGSVAGGKLLGKNPRRIARRGPDKSTN